MQSPVQATADVAKFTPLDPLRVLRQYMWLLIIVAVIGAVLGLAVAILCKKFIPEFTTRAALRVSSELNNPWAPPGDPTTSKDHVNTLQIFMRNQLLNIKSEDNLNQAIKRTDVRQTTWFESFPDGFARLENLKDQLQVSSPRGSSYILLAFSGRHQENLPEILNAVTQSYLDNYRYLLDSNTRELRIMMNSEKTSSDEQRESLMEEMARFRQEHDLHQLRTKGTEADLENNQLSKHMLQLKLMRQQYKQLYDEAVKNYEQKVADRPENILGRDQNNPAILENLRRRELMETQKRHLTERLGPNHKAIKGIESDMAVLQVLINEARLKAYLQEERTLISQHKGQIDALDKAMEMLNPRITEARQRLYDLDTKLAEFDRIAEELEAAEKSFDRAEELLSDMAMRMRRPESNRVVIAQPPTVPVLTFPKFPIMIMGITFFSVVLTIGSIFLKEVLDQRIKSPADLRLVPGTTLLGVVPDVTEDPTGPETIEGIVYKDPTGLIAESFRQVRTEVLSPMDRRGYKSLMIVGAQAHCGTSTVTNNLAASMAYNDRKVLIVDANFRRPSQSMLMGVQAAPGLVDVLKGSVQLETAVVRNSLENVDLLPAGDAKRTEPEILETKDFREMLDRLENEYNIVLIDAPPVLVASDSKLLTKQVDAIAVVVRAMSEKRGMVGRILRQLAGERADLLGVILNGVQSSAGGYFRKNYQAFYQYRETSGLLPNKPETAETT